MISIFKYDRSFLLFIDNFGKIQVFSIWFNLQINVYPLQVCCYVPWKGSLCVCVRPLTIFPMVKCLKMIPMVLCFKSGKRIMIDGSEAHVANTTTYITISENCISAV